MKKSIVVVCENEKCVQALQSAANEFGISIRAEVQLESQIKNEITIKEIQESTAVLFSVNKPIEEIDNIERFIDFEYYEVEPKFILEDAKSVLREILTELN